MDLGQISENLYLSRLAGEMGPISSTPGVAALPGNLSENAADSTWHKADH